MEKFTTLKSTVLPVPVSDIDTDMIIPAQFMTSVSKAGYGKNLFRRLRDADADFPLNQRKYEGAKIIIAPVNFGCGSSREHAIWALMDAGIKAVISSSFADIFAGNASKNGLLLIAMEKNLVDSLLKIALGTGLELEIDLEKQIVRSPLGNHDFQYDAFRKHCLLNGQDDLDYLLSHSNEISDYRSRTSGRFLPDTVQILVP